MIRISKASEYLGYPQFGATIMFAMLLHIMCGIVIYMSPNIQIVDIPVKPINIRLGDADVQQLVEEEPAPQAELSTSQEVDDAMTKLIRKSESEKIAKKIPVPDATKTNENTNNQAATKTTKPKIDAPRQFVRFTPPSVVNSSDGTVLGNSTDSKSDIKARYEQTISLWIQKFKLYPNEAKEAGIQGRTVVRIRIDRQGNVRYSSLEDTTGSAELDRAALDMVRRANPVPAVPENYVEGELFEFLIPVKFQLQQ